MSLPNNAPSRNSGKNWAKKVAAVFMKVCVQLASNGSPGERSGDQCGDRREDEDARATERKKDEAREADQDA